jgi:hypothetical protein
MEAKRLLRVTRFMPIEEWNVAEGLKWKNEHLKSNQFREVMERKPEAEWNEE